MCFFKNMQRALDAMFLLVRKDNSWPLERTRKTEPTERHQQKHMSNLQNIIFFCSETTVEIITKMCIHGSCVRHARICGAISIGLD